MSVKKVSMLGESTRLIPSNTPAVFEILPPPGQNLINGKCVAKVLTPNKKELNANVTHKAENGALRIEFVPTEVGTHIIEASIDGVSISGGPLIAKVYDIRQIKVIDVRNGVINEPCQFRVDASAAGEGQLEISINEGEVPNHVQVVSGGRCLVSFTPEQAKPHLIDIKFNGETVEGCPFICNVADTSCVIFNLTNLELIPVNQSASFHITMNGGGAAELAVSVCSPKGELPVRVTGDINTGFIAEFTPICVGGHSINVEYNGSPVQGTPFLAKAYDASKVVVGKLSNHMVGQPSQFTVDASDAGEGNLEITIASRGQNIPTQVQPQGGARFTVTFVPTAACEHTIHVSFNKISVPGCPKTFNISGMEPGPQVTFTGPGPIHEPNYFVITHGGGRLEDIEVNVEGPAGQSVPAQVHQTADGIFTAEFMPRVVGEHQVHVTINTVPTVGSPYSAKVYDVNAIKVKNVPYGCVNRAVSFLVETSHAGPGNLEVTVNGGRVPTSAQAQGPHVYAISFTPREAQTHTVELKFNGQNVPGSPFVCNISAAARIQPLQPIDKINVGHVFDFIVESDSKPIVEVVGPTRKNIAVQVEAAVSGQGYKVAFTPYEVGDHSVEVRMPGGEHVDGSPFLLKVYSVEKVFVTDIQPGVVGKSVSFGINASQAGAGNLEIIVAVNGRNVPNFVQSEGNAHFKVNFKPTEAAMHSLSVRFNGQAVPGSPFMCMITAPNDSVHQATASGDGLKQALVNSENKFSLKGFGNLMPQILITSPCGDQVANQISEREGAYEASFRPTVIGRHLISVTCNNQHINGSPYSCNVFDVSRVVVQGLDEKLGPVLLNAPVMFRVDAAGSGEGTLELVVSTETATVKAEVVACSRGLYEVTFVPKTVELHFVNITFNDLPVNNSPFTVAVQPSSQMLPVGSLARIEFPAKGLMAETFAPDNKPVLHQNVGNFLQFQTDQVGCYSARFYGETNNYITSRILNIFDASLVKITEVNEAFCYRPASVSISTYDAGEGEISVSVRCAGNKVRHSIRESNKNGIYEIVYHPTFVAPIKMTIYFNGVPISAKPLKINVLQANTGDEINLSGLGLLQAQVGKTTTFTIDTAKKSAKEFDVVVSGPEGEAFPVRCYQTKSGHLQAEYSINKPGKCHIEVLHQSVPLTGSPFICEAFDNNRVTVEGIPSSLIPLYSTVMLTVHTSDAGNAELEAFCIAPNKKNMAVEVMKIRPGTYGIEFTPYLSGQFKMDLTYGGEHIPASPITLNVSTSTKSDDKMLESDCLVCQPGRETSFIINSPNSPIAEIKRINEIGEQIVPKVKPLNNNKWVVTFTLLSVGHYEIHSSGRNGSAIAGSPWKVLCVEASKVTPVGGWSSLLDKEGRLMLPAQIIFNVAEAGPGKLFCKVDSNEVKIENLSENQLCVFISAENLSPGEHDLNLTWSGQLIENCPRSGYVNPQHYANQVVLSGRGLEVAQIGETAHFKIDATSAPAGRPEVILVYQDNSTLPVGITQPRPNENIWLASYTPQKMISDSLSLSVKWNGQLVKGCPMPVSLGMRTDAAKVVCSGEGLRHGILERDIKSWIDTRRAGPGELTAHCVGPRKVAFCELYEHGDATFTLNVKPQEPGPHLLTIKYGGQNVSGSPFSLKVAGKPDASKVRVHGPGIEHGVLATFQSRFTCDTRGAGAGQLTVRVRGPKGAFRVEMQRESQKDRTILCKYDPTEPGDYRVEVKWAGEFVPGSPFPVMIFDTEEELQRYLQAIEIQ